MGACSHYVLILLLIFLIIIALLVACTWNFVIVRKEDNFKYEFGSNEEEFTVDRKGLFGLVESQRLSLE